MIIIGSAAIGHWYPDFPRKPKDLDIIGTLNDKCYCESHVTSNKVELLENPVIIKYHGKYGGVTLNSSNLTTLKASHLMWNINWDKHMFDLQFLLKKGNIIDEKLFWELYDYWNEYHGKNKRSDLKMSKSEFFNNAINYDVLEHDELHKLINPVPTYILCLKEGKDVELDENKFDNLSYEQKLDFVREEVYVMAFERFKQLDYRKAYNIMLKKFIISHAPKFSLLFILNNYIELQKCKINFIKQIENGLQQNKQLVG